MPASLGGARGTPAFPPAGVSCWPNPREGQSAWGLLAEQGEKGRGIWRGTGRVPAQRQSRAFPPTLLAAQHVLGRGVMLPLSPPAGSEGDPVPAEYLPVLPQERKLLLQHQDILSLQRSTALLRQESQARSRLPRVGALTRPGGSASGQETLVTRLLWGNVRVPCKNICDPGWKGTLEGSGGGWDGWQNGFPELGGPGRALEEEPDPQWLEGAPGPEVGGPGGRGR